MKINEAPNINYAWAMLMVEELVRSGITYFCIAPGSRSSPLTVAAARHPKVETFIHYDERGLAFHALGYTSVTKRPAVLICSSGTAAVNFYPAVVETSKKKLPMILLTADRPPELQQTGALQTIDQVKLYGDYVHRYIGLPVPDEKMKPETVLTTIDQAVFAARSEMAGPVHINCMFREPLAPDKTDFKAKPYFASIRSWLKGEEPYTRYTKGSYSSDLSVDERLLDIINKTFRGVIVVGKLASAEEQQAVLELSDKLNWPVFPDIVSGLRTASHPNVIHYFDQILLSDTPAKNYPFDTVLHLGGRMTSKRWYQLLEKMRPHHYITVLNHPLRNDPLHLVTLRVKAPVMDVAESLTPVVEPGRDDEYLLFLQATSESIGRMIDTVTTEWEALNETGVARTISWLLPEEHGLFLSNSMPVREFDMYALPGAKPSIIGGNRGASGIDGTLASACGFARAVNQGTTLVIGDLAFLHDLNSLAMVSSLKHPLVIVIINNDGGGIFSFLPIAQSKEVSDIFDRFFGTPHGLEFSHAAKMFGLSYRAPKTMQEFSDAYGEALLAKDSTIIEVITERSENIQMHRFLQEKIKKAVDNMIR